jgi:hypothetical protein
MYALAGDDEIDLVDMDSSSVDVSRYADEGCWFVDSSA